MPRKSADIVILEPPVSFRPKGPPAEVITLPVVRIERTVPQPCPYRTEPGRSCIDHTTCKHYLDCVHAAMTRHALNMGRRKPKRG